MMLLAVKKLSLSRLLFGLGYLIVGAVATGLFAGRAHAVKPQLVEQLKLDWDRSGQLSVFSLSCSLGRGICKDANRLTIKRGDQPSWSIINRDDNWAALTPEHVFTSKEQLSALLKLRVAPSPRLLFVSSGDSVDGRVYLILIGNAGSLTILSPDVSGTPRVVFHSRQQLLAAILSRKDKSGIEMVGQSTDSEAWASKHAQSYDPYRVYLIRGYDTARYDLVRSKAYTLAHYCQWHGPTYDERFGAIGDPTGAAHCRVMSRASWILYAQRNPELFPER